MKFLSKQARDRKAASCAGTSFAAFARQMTTTSSSSSVARVSLGGLDEKDKTKGKEKMRATKGKRVISKVARKSSKCTYERLLSSSSEEEDDEDHMPFGYPRMYNMTQAEAKTQVKCGFCKLKPCLMKTNARMIGLATVESGVWNERAEAEVVPEALREMMDEYRKIWHMNCLQKVATPKCVTLEGHYRVKQVELIVKGNNYSFSASSGGSPSPTPINLNESFEKSL